MKCNTLRFGEIEVHPGQAFELLRPLIGFEETSFAVISDPETEPVQWLQSTSSPHVCVPVADPQLIARDYKVELPAQDCEELELRRAEDALVYCVIVLDEDVSRIRANLKAPIIFNTVNNKGKQVILDDPSMPVQYFFLDLNSCKSNKEVADVGANS